ncbi:MAG TPA: glucose-6-phosphate dehydrogenase, partial [Candidatus Sulfotelmatobacter sp.]|nr:glucose-6-phosphate dehydrogenase [Candidatus Sulfotelmatobacter sp.]
EFAVVGVAREPMTSDAFRARMRQSLEEFRTGDIDPALADALVRRARYLAGDYTAPATYAALRDLLAEIDSSSGTKGNYLHYLATPPTVFATVVHQLGAAGLVAEADGRWRRVIVEKPFGLDLESALALNQELRRDLAESQIYRIDHYLGKETVQNILVLRFANSIFEPLWNRSYVDFIEICALETVGVERRGEFYEQTGVLRDIVQNHLLEVLSLVAMEPPTTGGADDIRTEKLKVLKSLRELWSDTIPRNVVLGQYRGYRSEPDVSPASVTPTYAALRVFLDNWRWQGVPIYLRTGKKLKQRLTEVSLHMRPIPLSLFGRSDVCEHLDPNVLTIRIQPDEGISLRFASKIPGNDFAVGPVNMDMKYLETFGGEPPEAYERLLLDAMRGDATLFSRRDAVEQSWKWITPILRYFEENPPAGLPNYDPGSCGPQSADDLLHHDRREWREL